jgi:hypothetical protein
MSTLESIREIPVTLSPEQREKVLRYVESITGQTQLPVESNKSGERMESNRESQNHH